MLSTILICVFFQTYILAGVAAGAVKKQFHRTRRPLMQAELNWLEDPAVFQVNRLPAHSDHTWYLSLIHI